MSWWDEISKAWDETWAKAEAGWKALYDSAVAEYEAAITNNPEAYQAQSEAFVAELATSRGNLDQVKAALHKEGKTAHNQPLWEQYQAMERRYHELASGFYQDAQPIIEGHVGFVPLLVVGGLALGAGSIAWGVAAHEYAVNLREQTALAVKELDARIAASKEGRTLQASTLPPPPSIDLGAGASPLLLVGGLGLLGGLFFMLKRS